MTFKEQRHPLWYIIREILCHLTAAAYEKEQVKSRRALLYTNQVRRGPTGDPVRPPVLRLLNITTSNPQRPPQSSPPPFSSDAPVLPFRRRYQLLLVPTMPQGPRSDFHSPPITQLAKRAENLHLARTGHLRRGLPSSHSQLSTNAQ